MAAEGTLTFGLICSGQNRYVSNSAIRGDGVGGSRFSHQGGFSPSNLLYARFKEPAAPGFCDLNGNTGPGWWKFASPFTDQVRRKSRPTSQMLLFNVSQRFASPRNLSRPYRIYGMQRAARISPGRVIRLPTRSSGT